MPIIPTKTTYLEMHRPPALAALDLAAPCDNVHVQRADRPSCDFYRHLYRSVGADLHWVDRLVMPAEQLAAILGDDRVDVLVLSVGGELAGYSELDRRVADKIELAYFGLFPGFIGRGLGKLFLDWTLRAAWSHRPQRVWVHTCDLDHPAALPTYLKAGFRIYNEQIIAQFVPDEPELSPRPAQ